MNVSGLTERSLSLITAMGGWRTVAEAVASRALFLVAYVLTERVSTAALVAVGGVAVFAVVRVCTDRKYWQPAVGLVVVGVSATLAGSTGKAVDFFFPTLVLPAVAGVVFLASMLVRWPLIGLAVEAARGDRFGWQRDRARRRRYQVCTAMFLAKFVVEMALLVPLYLAGQVVALGVGSTLLGTPALGGCIYVCWRILQDHSSENRSYPAPGVEHDDVMHRDQIDAALAARLVAQQFPEWAELPVVPVEVNGWDNRTFRLGETMTVRLPTAEGYVASVEKEQTWLPRLAPWLPLPIPVPIAAGVPSDEYPWPWSIRGWIDGRPAVRERVADMTVFARDISGFLHALHGITPAEGPPAGLHSFYRGASLEHYDSETREAIAALGDRIDGPAATEVWDAALAARWTGRPVWFHGDIAYGNLLVDDLGRLSAVIDFGTSGVGDPACDLVITWVYFSGESRECFRTSMAADGAMWARARGWALWKALITFGAGRAAPAAETRPVDVIDDVLAEHAARTVSR